MSPLRGSQGHPRCVGCAPVATICRFFAQPTVSTHGATCRDQTKPFTVHLSCRFLQNGAVVLGCIQKNGTSSKSRGVERDKGDPPKGGYPPPVPLHFHRDRVGQSGTSQICPTLILGVRAGLGSAQSGEVGGLGGPTKRHARATIFNLIRKVV